MPKKRSTLKNKSTSKKKSTLKKKSVAKKKTSSKTKSKVTSNAPVDSYFILCNGQPIKNVRELADMLEEIRDEVFNCHVNPDKNDFATWIHDVFDDIELAKQLAGVKDKTNIRIVLYKHLIKKLS